MRYMLICTCGCDEFEEIAVKTTTKALTTFTKEVDGYKCSDCGAIYTEDQAGHELLAEEDC